MINLDTINYINEQEGTDEEKNIFITYASSETSDQPPYYNDKTSDDMLWERWGKCLLENNIDDTLETEAIASDVMCTYSNSEKGRTNEFRFVVDLILDKENKDITEMFNEIKKEIKK